MAVIEIASTLPIEYESFEDGRCEEEVAMKLDSLCVRQSLVPSRYGFDFAFLFLAILPYEFQRLLLPFKLNIFDIIEITICFLFKPSKLLLQF
jgi:hypothetical protein